MPLALCIREVGGGGLDCSMLGKSEVKEQNFDALICIKLLKLIIKTIELL